LKLKEKKWLRHCVCITALLFHRRKEVALKGKIDHPVSILMLLIYNK